MSAGISYMYDISGGCSVMDRCADCDYLKVDTEYRGFGKRTGRTNETYRCTKHPESEHHLWKSNYTACKLFSYAKNKTIFLENENGQLSFF